MNKKVAGYLGIALGAFKIRTDFFLLPGDKEYKFNLFIMIFEIFTLKNSQVPSFSSIAQLFLIKLLCNQSLKLCVALRKKGLGPSIHIFGIVSDIELKFCTKVPFMDIRSHAKFQQSLRGLVTFSFL